ncbi:MAG: prohibitin family protein, partial [Leptospiraceae bacterium]|nr:prohibitin family protein [Leptospiraceae bacterium]
MKIISILILSFVGCSAWYTQIPSGYKGILEDSSASKVSVLDHGRYNIAFSPSKKIEIYDMKWQTYREDHVEVITQDDLHIDVVASIIIRPDTTKLKNLHQEIGKNYYNTIVKSEFRTAIRNVLSSYPYVQI